jgi:D-alanine-D-alanine ligase-like ATP-grasp enzyme
MVQRRSKKSQNWTVTGRLAKIAGKGYMITNVQRSGGRVTSAEKAIRMSDVKGKDEAKQMLKQAEQISVASAKRLARTFTFIRRVGMDVGIDKNGKVWLIEANFRPSLSLFLKLSREAYNKIKRFG